MAAELPRTVALVADTFTRERQGLIDHLVTRRLAALPKTGPYCVGTALVADAIGLTRVHQVRQWQYRVRNPSWIVQHDVLVREMESDDVMVETSHRAPAPEVR